MIRGIARFFLRGFDPKYRPEAQANACSDDSMFVLDESDEGGLLRFEPVMPPFRLSGIAAGGSLSD
jgi:hypothetical protein